MSDRHFMVSYGQVQFELVTARVASEPETIGDEGRSAFIKDTWTIEGFAVASTHATFKTLYDRLQTELWKRKQPFLYMLKNGTDVTYKLVNHTRSQDVNGGPRPKALQLREWTGGLVVRISWTVELARANGAAGSNLGRTWVEQISVDERFLTTRTVRGLVRRDPDLPHDLRASVERDFPRPKGFKRTRSFTQQRDGAEFAFELKDVEQYYALPVPMTDGQASFGLEISTDDDGNEKWVKALSAWYEPPKTDNIRQAKADTMRLLVLLANQRFPAIQGEEVKKLALREDVFTGKIQIEYLSTGQGRASYQFQYATFFGLEVTNAGKDCADQGAGGSADLAFHATESGKGGSGVSLGNPGFPIISPTSGGGLPGLPFGSGAKGVPSYLQIVWSFDTRYRPVRLKPKVAGVPDIFQETANPDHDVTLYGSARFVGSLPDELPGLKFILALKGVKGAKVRRRYYPGKPYHDAAGTMIYPVDWTYKFAVDAVADMWQFTKNAIALEGEDAG